MFADGLMLFVATSEAVVDESPWPLWEEPRRVRFDVIERILDASLG